MNSNVITFSFTVYTKKNISSAEFSTKQNNREIPANVDNVLKMAIRTNPYVDVARDTLGAVQDYRGGGNISDIVKQRFVKLKLIVI